MLFSYAKNDQKSFNEIKDWINLFNENNNRKDIVNYLVETKDDLERVVDENISREFAKTIKFGFKKTSSARDDNSINELFQEMGEILYKDYLKNNKGNLKQSGLKLSTEEKKNSFCCLFKSDG